MNDKDGIVWQPHWTGKRSVAAEIESDGSVTRVIGKIAAGTTLTQAMIDDMMRGALRGEAVHTYMDGDVLKVETVDIRLDPPPKSPHTS